ncbi:conserved hypothetical protein [Ricinus communis]|uniref:Uncharacterized protein n=1 Tax=Ricinus communis TaxID=3988 RepID=B9T9D1_RICCO|nr:conserved hypothetical protein [Ricinus communis]
MHAAELVVTQAAAQRVSSERSIDHIAARARRRYSACARGKFARNAKNQKWRRVERSAKCERRRRESLPNV